MTFEVRRGETLGLVGESGCGKSTIGRAMIRLRDPDRGHASGSTASTSTLAVKTEALRRMRRRMQIIFQDPYGSLDPRMTVGVDHRRADRDAQPGVQGDAKQRAGRRAAAAGRPRPEVRQPLPARVLGRPAPAHRRGPGARRRARVHRLRRADLGARRVDPGAGPQPADRPARAARADLPVRRPRPVGRQAHQRSRRGDVPRQGRRDRAARHAVRGAGPPLHARPAVGRAGARSGRRAQAPPGDPQGRRAEPGQPAARLPVPHPLLAVRAARPAGELPDDRPAAPAVLDGRAIGRRATTPTRRSRPTSASPTSTTAHVRRGTPAAALASLRLAGRPRPTTPWHRGGERRSRPPAFDDMSADTAAIEASDGLQMQDRPTRTRRRSGPTAGAGVASAADRAGVRGAPRSRRPRRRRAAAAPAARKWQAH